MDFSKIPFATGSATALLGVVFLLFCMGMIIPRRSLQDTREDRDSRLAEKQKEVDLWKSAYDHQINTNQELVRQVSTLMEVARTADHVLRALPAGGGDVADDGSTGSGVVSR
jgi:hypothetical protein